MISCVEKGDAESDATDFLNLCTACWTWRKLPDDYFPQILNELVCQENDFCLSGLEQSGFLYHANFRLGDLYTAISTS